MSCLDATFTLTPRSPWYYQADHKRAWVYCYGADFMSGNPYDFSSLYNTNRYYFDPTAAADPNIDYAQWPNRRNVPQLSFVGDLSDYGAAKQLALIFGFDADFGWPGRVQIYTAAGLLHDQTLAVGDNQFLIELETLDYPIYLDFIHAGGSWFFKGLSGYVV